MFSPLFGCYVIPKSRVLARRLRDRHTDTRADGQIYLMQPEREEAPSLPASRARHSNVAPASIVTQWATSFVFHSFIHLLICLFVVVCLIAVSQAKPEQSKANQEEEDD